MSVKPLSPTPFLTEAFKDDGGGIDFLGLRLINLRILGQNLLPGVNNQTRDIGIFCLGVWIPWKFKQVCKSSPNDYTEANYKAFREALEVVMADGVKDGSQANDLFGSPNRRIGVNQDIVLPGKLAFSQDIHRTDATSLYAAPLYGPSLRYLDFIGYAAGEEGKVTQIHTPSENEDTQLICKFVDTFIGEVPLVQKISQLNFHASAEELNHLQCSGLHPQAFQNAPLEVISALIRHLLDTNQNEIITQRLLTTALITDTLKSIKKATYEELIAIWHTGLISKEVPLQLSDKRVKNQQLHWSLFETRQYQRCILERFLIHFEQAVKVGRSSITEITEHIIKSIKTPPKDMHTLVCHESIIAGGPPDFEKASQWWNLNVSKDHPSSEESLWQISESDDVEATLVMLARWILRSSPLIEQHQTLEELSWGGESRISIRWFYNWLLNNQDRDLQDFLKELFSNLVFTQHLRVGLSRLNPNEPMQRLRFALGDLGITPTTGMRNSLGSRDAPWMADRLDAWLDLLADVNIVERHQDGLISLGINADQVTLSE